MRNILLVTLALGLAGCATSSTQPAIASSSAEAGYATAYPDDLQGAAKTLSDDCVEAHNLTGGFAQRGAELKTPADANTLVAIVDRADAAGRSQAFADQRAEAQAVHAFWDDERGPITGRVAGAAQSKVNDAKCENADVSGAVAYTLKESVDKQLEKRLRAKNDAQVLVERYKIALGPNAPVAQKLADDVANASYIVNVALVDDKNRLTRLLAEKSAIDSTLQHTVDDERAFQQEKGRTDAEKKASEERIATINKSRTNLGGAVVNAEVATRGLDDQIKQAKGDYDAALKALKDQIRAHAAPAAQ